jgi:beta-alanine--pyruvate transaminase
MMNGPPDQIELFHGYTYSGHPAACAAGLAAMQIYQDEKLLTRGAGLTDHWQNTLHGLRGLPHVADIRAIGMLAGIELTPRQSAPGTRGYDVFLDCFQRGLLIRLTGDIIALSPPLIIEPAQIDEITTIISGALRRVA